MKKFSFTIRGNQYDVNIKNIEDDIADIEVNGTRYEVEIHRAVKQAKTPKLMRSKIEPLEHGEKARTSSPTEKKGAGIVKAPLPGTILEVKVRQGDTVKIGDTLLIMEAMKMENNIKADRHGKVEAIKVNVGDSVLEGEVLLEIGG
jgi:biotin carboxyl carrier protein